MNRKETFGLRSMHCSLSRDWFNAWICLCGDRFDPRWVFYDTFCPTCHTDKKDFKLFTIRWISKKVWWQPSTWNNGYFQRYDEYEKERMEQQDVNTCPECHKEKSGHYFHTTWLGGRGWSVLCESCWSTLTIEQRLKYHFEHWESRYEKHNAYPGEWIEIKQAILEGK